MSPCTPLHSISLTPSSELPLQQVVLMAVVVVVAVAVVTHLLSVSVCALCYRHCRRPHCSLLCRLMYLSRQPLAARSVGQWWLPSEEAAVAVRQHSLHSSGVAVCSHFKSVRASEHLSLSLFSRYFPRDTRVFPMRQHRQWQASGINDHTANLSLSLSFLFSSHY